MRFSYFALLILLTTPGCKPKRETTVRFHIEQAMDRMAYLEQVALSKEKKMILDSQRIRSGRADLIFHIPESEERVYRLKVSESNVLIYFVNDVPEIRIRAEILKPEEYRIEGSPANASLQDFLRGQRKRAALGRQLAASGDSLGLLHQSGRAVKRQYDSLQTVYFQQYRNYVDTVKSPGAFLLLYNQVDFGNDHAAHKAFILRAVRRFPQHTRIQALKDRTLAYLRIYEEEYEVGSTLPPVVLPSDNGLAYSTSALQGRYHLIHFWSTWCGPCMRYFEEIEKAKQEFPANHFEAVSIALDDEKEQWLQMIRQKNLNWPQLIDVEMWEGSAARTYKIDSIPFIFLADPAGRVLKKAFPPDSLLYYLKQYVK